MTNPPEDTPPRQLVGPRFLFRFTPAEWRRLLADAAFLRQPDNSYIPPRRLMGVSVEIVPDHDFG